MEYLRGYADGIQRALEMLKQCKSVEVFPIVFKLEEELENAVVTAAEKLEEMEKE